VIILFRVIQGDFPTTELLNAYTHLCKKQNQCERTSVLDRQMNLSRNFRLVLFGSLYFVQGTLMSYFMTFNILYVGESGYGPAEIGIFTAILTVPFVLKIFLGMLSDGVNLLGMGHRKPYILIGLIGQAVAMLVLPHIPIVEGWGAFVLVALAASISMALHDACTDGLAMDITLKNERSAVQGVMTGSRAAGMLVMLLIGGKIIELFGWQWLFYVVGLSVIPALLFVRILQVDPSKIQRQVFQWSSFKTLGQGVVLMVAGLGLLTSVTLNGITPFFSNYLRDALHISIGNIGFLVALSMVGRIAGAFFSSRMANRINHKPSLVIGIGLTSVACFGLALSERVALIAIFAFLFGVAYGYFSSVYGVLAMNHSDLHIAASMFAIFMMFINLGAMGGQIIGGFLTESIGFNQMILVMGLINLVSIFFVIGIFKKTLQ